MSSLDDEVKLPEVSVVPELQLVIEEQEKYQSYQCHLAASKSMKKPMTVAVETEVESLSLRNLCSQPTRVNV